MVTSAQLSDGARPQGLAIFDTPIGACGLAWGVHGIVGVQLPEASAAATRARLQQRFPGARTGTPPPAVQRTCDGIAALLRGEAVLLDDVTLDMAGIPALHQRVYAITRGIRPGTTLTYGEVAQRLGDASLARGVGQALARNPFAPIVPCHRVMAAGGQAGGFSARGGLATKLRLLTIEGAPKGHEGAPCGPWGAPGLFDRDAGPA